ncbi:hypothetical protein [Mesorhizobium sp. M0847]|uniref:hypothetical protein n=1 Tax=unclassified Mesorhizobium TaxID=325217 RepID=UPI00333BCB71
MGQIIGPDCLIRMDAAQVGDLVVFSYENARALGLILEFNEERGGLLAVLSSLFELPRMLRVTGDINCMNYGQDWALEPIDSQVATPSHFETNRRAGLLVLTKNGWFMNFASSYVDQFGRFNWEWRDMKAFTQSARLESGIVFDAWRLWASAADRNYRNGQPLLTYKAEVQKGTQG